MQHLGKRLAMAAAVAVALGLLSSTAFADSQEVVQLELQAESSSPPVATAAPPVAVPAGPAGYTQENPDPEMIAVEKALGKPMYREYQHYQRRHASGGIGYVEYEYNVMKRKRNGGIVLACVLSPLFFAIGTTLNVVWQQKAADQRASGEFSVFNEEKLSWMLFGLFAAAGTGTLIPGVINLAVGASKMKKLKPAYKQYVEGAMPAAETPATENPPETPATETTSRLQLHLAPVFDRHGTPAGAGLALVF